MNRLYALLAAPLLTVFLSTAYAQVEMIDKDSIAATLSFPTFAYEVPSGNERLLLLFVMNEYNSGINYHVTSATYGGKTMAELGSVESPYLLSRSEIQVFYLPESDIKTASDSLFDLTYNNSSTTGLSGIYYSAMVINNVNQTAPISELRTNSQVSGTTISTPSSISASADDAIISLAMDSENGHTYSASSGFSLVEGLTAANRTSAIGWNSASSTMSSSPSFVSSATTTRQALMAFRVNSGNGYALPVELTRFDATANEQGVLLEWNTATEKNADFFQVERSTDYQNWEVIGRVTAIGFSNTGSSYKLLDEDTPQSTLYYRLVQVDFDGKSQVYGPLTIEPLIHETGKDKEITTYPNPSNGQFTLCAQGFEQNAVAVFDTHGNQVHSLIAQGCTEVQTALPSGLYYLRVGDQTHRIMVN